jgi:hypothetical protein
MGLLEARLQSPFLLVQPLRAEELYRQIGAGRRGLAGGGEFPLHHLGHLVKAQDFHGRRNLLSHHRPRHRGAPWVAFLEGLDIGRDLRDSFPQEFFFGGRIITLGPLTLRAAMFRRAGLVPEGLDNAGWRRDRAPPSADFNMIFGLAHIDVASDEVVGYGVAIGIDAG